MFIRPILISLFAVVCLASSSQAQTTLRWKFREGDTFYLEETSLGKTTVTVDGQKFTDEQNQHRLSRFVVKSNTRDEIVLEQRIEWWKSTVTSAGVSQDDAKLLEQVTKGLPFTLHLRPSGAITRFDGYDLFLKKLEAADPAEAKRFKVLPDDDVLRGPLAQVFDMLPAGPIQKDATWKRDHVVRMGPMGTFKMATTFTYLGLGKGGEQIDIKALLSFQPPRLAAAELGFKVIKLDLTKKEATGKLVFDNAKGRLALLETTMPLTGTVVLDVQGVQSQVEMEGTETRTVRLLDKKPAAPKR